jgi:hypothetical protein
MIYPAETNHSLVPWLLRERKKGATSCLIASTRPSFLRALSRSASQRKTGNANAYIGNWQFVIQENLAGYRGDNVYAEKAGKAR